MQHLFYIFLLDTNLNVILIYLYIYLAQNLWFWTGIIFIRVYVSVCVFVSVYIGYLKKFLTDFDETWQDGV